MANPYAYGSRAPDFGYSSGAVFDGLDDSVMRSQTRPDTYASPYGGTRGGYYPSEGEPYSYTRPPTESASHYRGDSYVPEYVAPVPIKPPVWYEEPKEPESLPPPPPPPPPRKRVDDGTIYGTLFLTIHSAKNLPKPSGALAKLGNVVDKIDPWCRISTMEDGQWIKHAATFKCQNTNNPIWNEGFRVHFAGQTGEIKIDVRDEALKSKSLLGYTTLDPKDFVGKNQNGQRHILKWGSKKPPKTGDAKIYFSTRWVDADEIEFATEVKYNSYPQRTGCKLTMYQDTHLSLEHPLPPVPTARGPYRNHDCWKELFADLNQAREFIYMCGWSVWTSLRMVREPLAYGQPTLGEVLKRKAREGVIVRVLVWDDFTSNDSKLLNTITPFTKNGIMATFDEETQQFFAGTKVICEGVYRETKGYAEFGQSTHGDLGGASHLAAKAGLYGNFTHHQKSVMMDVPNERGSGRRVAAYVGGLDLTNGRYDDQQHSLFKTLAKQHKEDFLNGCHPEFDPEIGPREPWHDIHGKVEGPVARDVVLNFRERWYTQVQGPNKEKVPPMGYFGSIISGDQEGRDVKDPWKIQFFRSIDRSAAVDAGRGIDPVEQGIQEAYIHNIRRAQKYIYVENQYFLGSAKFWDGYKDGTSTDIECKNRVPFELAEKCCDKIKHGERFSCYILLPMYSEGIAESATIQGILYWQRKTIDMMYSRIGAALEKYGPKEANPRDYLTFFCLGNREPGQPPYKSDKIKDLQRNIAYHTRRHSIYVHSKMMIVDDEYILIGSANINERSMAGARDSEMAVGCVEEGFEKKPGDTKLPKGQVSGFRKSLWAEHLDMYDPIFDEPESLACIKLVNFMSEANWNTYCGDEVKELPHGHLLKYPYDVSKAGTISATKAVFPDHPPGAKVFGKCINTALHLMTT